MNNEDKIKIYEEIIEEIKNNQYENLFVCNYLHAFSEDNEELFLEFYLFREKGYTHAWLTYQLFDFGLVEINSTETEIDYQLNKFRIFILQLCIEMLK